MTRDELKKTKPEESITRRKALQKMSYAAFASSTMFLLLNNPTKVYAASPTSEPGGGTGAGDGFTKSGTATAPDNDKDDWNNDDDPWKQ